MAPCVARGLRNSAVLEAPAVVAGFDDPAVLN